MSQESEPKFMFGYKKSPTDVRDYHYRNFRAPVKLPTKFSRRSELGPTKDQGIVGACVAFAACVLKDWQESKEIGKPYDCAERFIYARRSNSPSEGMWPRDALDILLNDGVPPESMCPGHWYPPTNGDTRCDDQDVLAAAKILRIKNYARCYTREDLKQAIFQDGIGFVGVPVFYSWISGSATITGHIPMPSQGEPSIGGHMIAFTGWDDETGEFEFRNSWYLVPGITPWGDQGNGWLPYDYWERFAPSGDAEGWTAPDIVGPIPPEPPDPIKKLFACLRQAWANKDISAFLECIKTFLHDEGWLVTASKTKNGSIRIIIHKPEQP